MPRQRFDFRFWIEPGRSFMIRQFSAARKGRVLQAEVRRGRFSRPEGA
jgi:hypothetical protein